jgi:uncharacterized protein YeaO (DUF488 family)
MIARRASDDTSKRLQIKRVYERPAADDGLRILVDRLWPRGLTKAKARVDLWLKDVAPSDALRHHFHGDPADWKEFVAAYRRELAREPAKAAAADLLQRLRREPVTTLLYGSRDEVHNNAVALKQWLERRLGD